MASDIEAVLTSENFDLCVNASGSAVVQFSFENPEIDYELNVHNVFIILNSLRKFQPQCKFLNFSSAAVYGNPKSIPISEETETGPLSPYGWHKLASENLCCEFYQNFGLQTISLRVFSVYGPGLPKQLFWDIHKKALQTDRIKLFGTGEESRDFIYIDDLMHAVETIVEKAMFNGQPVNIASGKQTTIKNAALSFLKTYKPDAVLEFNNAQKKGDPANWEASINKLISLGYQSKTDFETGIKNTALWMRNQN